MSVYFLECSATKLIKIGRTESLETLPGRIRSLSTICPAPLTLLGVLIEEKQDVVLHLRFRHIHHHGEWFMPTDELKAFIKENTSIPDFGSQVMENGRCRAITGKGKPCSNAADSLDGYCKMHREATTSWIMQLMSTGELVKRPVAEIQVGNVIVTVTGAALEVVGVIKETDKTKWFQLKPAKGNVTTQMLRKSVIVLVENQDYQSKD